MTTAAERARRWRERTHRELADDVANLLRGAHEAVVFRALAALPPSALTILRDGLSEAPGGRRSLNGERPHVNLRDLAELELRPAVFYWAVRRANDGEDLATVAAELRLSDGQARYVAEFVTRREHAS